uniref:Uncharacterized protein n=1 Tax=Chlamydomonas leiostraca TaxID=1034604 RepID=A0A7S0RNS4_9CHLO|mmetsp:Transcript_26844/g.68354  ORF Transcript_26844/g.68354 Transcript_26844/m.68354 type:complete len:100 (+) Transcript_26844:554-853(+)
MDDLCAHPELLGANRMLHSLSLLVSGGSEGVAHEDAGAAAAAATPTASKPAARSADSASEMLGGRAVGAGVVGDRKGSSSSNGARDDVRRMSFDLPVSL